MGFHICEWCQQAGTLKNNQAYSPYSSADVTLVFESGRSWQFPWVGLPHYITEHGYCPPKDFIDDVMNSKVVEGDFAQTKSFPTAVGYLRHPEDIPTVDEIPEGFVEKLAQLVENAHNRNDCLSFRQTRSS